MTRHRVPRPISPLGRPTPGQPQPLSPEESPPTLDPHRRRLFAQRLAILIQRLRAAPPVVPEEDVAHDS
jgi:hypothetical protein